MSREENIEIALRWTEAVNAREVPEEVLAPDVRLENVTTAVTDRTYRGADGFRQWFSDFFDVLDDARYEGEVIEAGDDYVVGKARFVGADRSPVRPWRCPTTASCGSATERSPGPWGIPTRREALEAVGLREEPAELPDNAVHGA